MNIYGEAGLKILQNGIFGLRLKFTPDNEPVLLLTSHHGDLALDMSDIYEQTFKARLEYKLIP